MKKFTVVVLSLFMWSGNAFSATNCNASITASTPTGDFVDHGNGTVTHAKTGLMWKQCSEGLSGASCGTGTATAHTWQAALQLAETLNNGTGFAGYTDWRVPNIKELASIVEEQCLNPAINSTVFPDALGVWYWSSSPRIANNSDEALGVGFNNGDDNYYNRRNNGFTGLVRLVRGGQ